MRRLFGTIFTLQNAKQLTIFLVGGLAILWFAAPQLLPQLGRGPECVRLAHPPGGNQRSLLALQDQNQALELEVRITNSRLEQEFVVGPNDPLEVQIIFENEDAGPIYLYYNDLAGVPVGDPNALAPPGSNQGLIGLFLEIASATNSNLRFSDGVTGYTVADLNAQNNGSFELDSVYVLRGRHSCYINVTLSTERRNALGLGPGEYRIRAYYRNPTPGVFVIGPNPTATPIFVSQEERTRYGQGVWTGQAASERVRFSIAQPGQ